MIVGKDTKISWTDATFNLWHGCTKVSPACDHCYAETFSRRCGWNETPKAATKFPIWGKDAERRFFGDKHWNQPLVWNAKAEKEGRRWRVFCSSMSDVMEDNPRLNGRLHGERAKLYALIEKTPWLDWLLLTKRPQNFKRFLPQSWLNEPRKNVWGMTTVESAEYLWRLEAVMETPFAVRGLSMEPLFGAVALPSDFLALGKQAWTVTGGESGVGARPAHPRWYQSLRDQSVKAGVPFHFKQWGEWAEVDEHGDGKDHEHDIAIRTLPAGPKDCFISTSGQVVHQESEMADDVAYRWMKRIGKLAAGRTLDGREWNEFPEARP